MKKTLTFIADGILGGALIGMGCIAYSAVSNHVLGAVLFSLGLLSVIKTHALLYTGIVGFVKENWKKLLPVLALNFIGAWGICALASFTRIDLSAAQTIAATKMNDSFLSLYLLGAGCGICIYLAVIMKENVLLVILPVLFFILCGFEHCVADIGYFTLAKCWSWDALLRILVIALGNATGSIVLHCKNYL